MAERFLQCQSCKKVSRKVVRRPKRRRVEKPSRAGSLAGFKARVGSRPGANQSRILEERIEFTIHTVASRKTMRDYSVQNWKDHSPPLFGGLAGMS
jgi:hypothetical protein